MDLSHDVCGMRRASGVPEVKAHTHLAWPETREERYRMRLREFLEQ